MPFSPGVCAHRLLLTALLYCVWLAKVNGQWFQLWVWCNRYSNPYPGGLSNGAAAGITIAVLIMFFAAVVAPIAWCKHVKRRRRSAERAAQEESRARLVTPEQDSEKV